MFRITYIDNEDNTHTEDVDIVNMGINAVEEYYLNKLGYLPKIIDGEELEE